MSIVEIPTEITETSENLFFFNKNIFYFFQLIDTYTAYNTILM